MTPTIGRIVLIERHDTETIMPAIITSVTPPASAGSINCKAFEDSLAPPFWLTKVPKQRDLGPNEPWPQYCWYWPPGSPGAVAEAEPEQPRQDLAAEAEQDSEIAEHETAGPAEPEELSEAPVG